MPLSWIFGVADEALPPPEEDALDPELSITRAISTEDVKGGTFPSINAPPSGIFPSSSSSSIIAQVAAAGSSQGWKVLSRTDSTEEMTGGVFPCVNDQPPSPTNQEKASGSKPLRPVGLPPPAPRSPPMLAFSRRGGRAVKAPGSKPADAVVTSPSQQQAPGAAPVAQASSSVAIPRPAERPVGSPHSILPNRPPVSRPPVELSFYARQEGRNSGLAQEEHSSSAPPVISTAELPIATLANNQEGGLSAASGASDIHFGASDTHSAAMSTAANQASSKPTRRNNAPTETQVSSPPEYVSPPNSRPPPAVPRPPARPTAALPGTGGSPTPPSIPPQARDYSAPTSVHPALGAVAGMEVEGRAASVDVDGADGYGEESRRSSKRSSSFSTAGRSIVGQSGLLGCFQRRKTAAATRPTHPSFRLLGSRNSTPMSTPGRFRSKRRSSEPPVPSRPQANNMAQAIAGASRPARTAASRPGPVALEGPRARDAASLAGAGAGSGPRGGDGARPGEGKNEDRTAPEELKEEEEEEPEAVVAATVTMNGLLECGRAMRMDGKFVGDLVSTGSITVGPTGKVTGDLKGLKFLRVEGQVVGDVVCDRVVVLHEGKVYGDITAVSITVGPHATMRGMMNVVDSMSSAEAESKAAEPGQLDQGGGEGSSSDSDDGLPDLVPMPSFHQESMMTQTVGSDEEDQQDDVVDHIIMDTDLSMEDTKEYKLMGENLSAEDSKVDKVVGEDLSAENTKLDEVADKDLPKGETKRNQVVDEGLSAEDTKLADVDATEEHKKATATTRGSH